MTQVVFVHGVATRMSPTYHAEVAARDRRFADVAFAGSPIVVANPYWGEFGTATGDLKCIPAMTGPAVALGIGGAPSASPTHVDDVLLRSARSDFAAVVGALSVIAIDTASAAGSPDDVAKAERIAIGAASYAEAVPTPSWLNAMKNDTEFLAKLSTEARALAPGGTNETLGLMDEIRRAGQDLAGRLSNLVNAPIARAGREILTPKIAVFIGDVFKYLRGPASGRQKIRDVVMDAVASAADKARTGDEKLVIIGHSMGGVILYDLLTDPLTRAQLGDEFRADLLLTIGSQVALFAEMDLYAANETSTDRLARPKGVARWWNVYDRMDMLSFVAEPVFDGVEDFSVDTVAGVADAHGAYFSSMVFYKRLNARLDEAGLV